MYISVYRLKFIKTTCSLKYGIAALGLPNPEHYQKPAASAEVAPKRRHHSADSYIYLWHEEERGRDRYRRTEQHETIA